MINVSFNQKVVLERNYCSTRTQHIIYFALRHGQVCPNQVYVIYLLRLQFVKDTNSKMSIIGNICYLFKRFSKQVQILNKHYNRKVVNKKRLLVHNVLINCTCREIPRPLNTHAYDPLLCKRVVIFTIKCYILKKVYNYFQNNFKQTMKAFIIYSETVILKVHKII